MDQLSMFGGIACNELSLLELFGGVGSPRVALRNMNIPVRSIDYVEIDQQAVDSYNSMFRKDLKYRTQDICGWTLKPNCAVHGSPCQDWSIAGHQGAATKEEGRINRGAGADEGSGTRSSLMWETCNIIEKMGEWRPSAVVWENVANVRSVYMRHNHDKYLAKMEELGYTNSFDTLIATEFGLPQTRRRVFTVSLLNGKKFDFSKMKRYPMRPISEFLETGDVGDQYMVTQDSILGAIGKGNGEIRRATVIKDVTGTITCRQDRTPTNVIDLGDGKYRFLTERECWRLQGYSDAEFEAALKANPAPAGKMNRALYKQAGNSIPVPIFESMFDLLLTEYGIAS